MNQLELAGDKKEGEEGEKGVPAAEDPEVIEARREEEERRRQKYAKMENEREKVRQGIRDKYNIKKQEEVLPPLPDLDNSLNAKKKTPAQLQINTDDDGKSTNIVWNGTRASAFFSFVYSFLLEFNPIKMATGLFETVKTSVTGLNISFPWSSKPAGP